MERRKPGESSEMARTPLLLLRQGGKKDWAGGCFQRR